MIVLQRAAAEPAAAGPLPPPPAAGGGAQRRPGPLRTGELRLRCGRPVLQDVTLDIRRGDVIAVLGPNGAGKTTLVKHAIGLLKPTAGRVLVDGRDTRDAERGPDGQHAGLCLSKPQPHALRPHRAARKLAFGPTNLSHTPRTIEEEVQEALEIVNLTGPGEGSAAGALVRPAEARQHRRHPGHALAHPGDGRADGRAGLPNYMDFMDAILQMPGFEAILFITHDIDLAVIYANRVLLVSAGPAGGRRPAARSAGRLRPPARAAAWCRLRCCRPTWSVCPADRTISARRGAGAPASGRQRPRDHL